MPMLIPRTGLVRTTFRACLRRRQLAEEVADGRQQGLGAVAELGRKLRGEGGE
jgi:hypothetical protein